jgi:hypothetical protein
VCVCVCAMRAREKDREKDRDELFLTSFHLSRVLLSLLIRDILTFAWLSPLTNSIVYSHFLNILHAQFLIVF